jgi:hypothetical protein
MPKSTMKKVLSRKEKCIGGGQIEYRNLSSGYPNV